MTSKDRALAEGLPDTRQAPRRGAGHTRSLGDQARALARTIGLSAVGVVAAGLAVIALSRAFDTQLYDMTADPNAVSGRPFAVGMLSTLAVMAWTAAGAICVAGAAMVRAADAQHEVARVLALAGSLSLLLAADDAFMLHEKVLPDYLIIPEPVVYVGYLVFALLLVRRAWPIVARTDYLLAVLAAAALGASIAVDLLLPFNSRVSFVEDMLKFSGIVLWLVYVARTTRRLAVEAVLERA